MNAVVVDTDVVSLVFKADRRAEKYVSALSAPDLLVSFMTEAELEHWILQARWMAHLRRLLNPNLPNPLQ